MKIAITGGKGGTGKSTVATALAVELAKKHKVLLVDADVDCPNDHLIFNVKQKKVKDVFQMIPLFNPSKCLKCGDCMSSCTSNAIVHVKNKLPIFMLQQCNGCNACFIACSRKGKAIKQGKKKIGEIRSGKNHGVDLLSGFMNVGHEEPTPIVKEVKRIALEKEKDYDYVIIDTSPGTHCNVINVIMDVDLAIAVTEPTPLGAHDLKLILDLTRELKIKSSIVINKSTVGDKNLVKKIAGSSKILCEIPYKDSICKSYSKGEVIENNSIKKLAAKLK